MSINSSFPNFQILVPGPSCRAGREYSCVLSEDLALFPWNILLLITGKIQRRMIPLRNFQSALLLISDAVLQFLV